MTFLTWLKRRRLPCRCQDVMYGGRITYDCPRHRPEDKILSPEEYVVEKAMKDYE